MQTVLHQLILEGELTEHLHLTYFSILSAGHFTCAETLLPIKFALIKKCFNFGIVMPVFLLCRQVIVREPFGFCCCFLHMT